MKSVLIIGLGRFGRHLAERFNELNNEVMIVDSDERLIEEMSVDFADAQAGDCTNERVINALGVRNFDICFVCIGSSFQSSLEITALLSEYGAKKIVAKASSERHARLLLRVGANEVVYPERDMAQKTAVRFSENNIIDYIPVTADCSIYETPVLERWVNRSVLDTNARNKYRINIVAVKSGNEIMPAITADYVFKKNDILYIIGKTDDVLKLLGNKQEAFYDVRRNKK